MTDKFPGFSVVRRGYDRQEVDRFLLGEDGGPLGSARFTIVRRGYDRGEVDAFLAGLQSAREADGESRTHGRTHGHRADLIPGAGRGLAP